MRRRDGWDKRLQMGITHEDERTLKMRTRDEKRVEPD